MEAQQSQTIQVLQTGLGFVAVKAVKSSLWSIELC